MDNTGRRVMERTKLEQKLWDIKISNDNCEILEVLAFCDRLTAENEKLRDTKQRLIEQSSLWEAKYFESQSHLDKICEHAQPQRGFLSNREIVKQLQKGGWFRISRVIESIADYLDSQKPSEKPETCHWNRFCPVLVHVGAEKDCPICNPHGYVHTPDEGIAGNPPKDWVSTKDFPPAKPKCEHKNVGKHIYYDGFYRPYCLDCHTWMPKPLTQCPECGGTRQKIVRYDFSGTWAILYERCPRCRGEGVI
jgi:hypothetical protein